MGRVREVGAAMKIVSLGEDVYPDPESTIDELIPSQVTCPECKTVMVINDLADLSLWAYGSKTDWRCAACGEDVTFSTSPKIYRTVARAMKEVENQGPVYSRVLAVSMWMCKVLFVTWAVGLLPIALAFSLNEAFGWVAFLIVGIPYLLSVPGVLELDSLSIENGH
jgi:hypothetical protein